MLPKKFRLKKGKDFKNVWKKGKGFFLKELGIKRVKNNLNNSRFGFIVSSKVVREAYLRNKVKRRLREIIRKSLEKIPKGYDFLIIAREGIGKLNYWEMEERIKTLLRI